MIFEQEQIHTSLHMSHPSQALCADPLSYVWKPKQLISSSL
uniref:Uncharacterized protein n=1 Tax=Megaselia scalaris TaxID=36166 RepID=T1GQV4_MEGSC